MAQTAETECGRGGRRETMKEKPMHGMHHQQTEDRADLNKSFQLLQRAGLKDSRSTNHGSTKAKEVTVFAAIIKLSQSSVSSKDSEPNPLSLAQLQ